MIRCISSSKHYNYDKTKHSCHGWTNLNRKMIYKFSFFIWIKMTCTFSYLHTWSSLPSYLSWFHIVSYLYRITHDARKISIYVWNNGEMLLFRKKYDVIYFGNVIYDIYITRFRVTQCKIHFASYFMPIWNETWIKSMFFVKCMPLNINKEKLKNI